MGTTAPRPSNLALIVLLLAAGGCGRVPRARYAPRACGSPAGAALAAVGRVLDGERCGCAYAPAPASTQELPRRLDGTDEARDEP